MYVMLALYFFSCVRDVFLVVYYARIRVGYHCCLFFGLLLVFVTSSKNLLSRLEICLNSQYVCGRVLVIGTLFFDSFLYDAVYMGLLRVVRIVFCIV
ncbi:hypothetical protein HanHA89_Chr16g0679811 [Helianthus annuus]|nr:hypothetical protein HanHA89_Chr16g0679811 [Helianthus annuus]